MDKFIIGTWPLSGDFGHMSLKQVEEVLTYSYEQGLRQFDTAPNYGKGFMEYALGKVFHGQKVLINTKVGNHPFAGKSFTTESLKRSVDESLTRLAIPAIHVLFLHNPRGEVETYEPILDLLEEFKRQGVIRLKGISLAKGYPYRNELLTQFDVIQEDINLLYQEPLKRQLPATTKLMARSPLATGILSGNLTNDRIFSPEDHRSGWLKCDRLQSIMKRVEAIQEIAPHISLPSLSRRFLLQASQVSHIIIGVRKTEHVKALKEDLEQEPLGDSLIGQLKELYLNDFGLEDEQHLGF